MNSNKNNSNIAESYSRRLIGGKVTATAGIRNPENLNMVYGIGANRIEMLRVLEKRNKFNLIWYITFIVLGLICLIIEPKSWFYVIRLAVILVNLDLVSKGKLSGVYIGTIECFMYAYICFNSALYGEILKMFLINVPLNIITIISWTKNIRKQKKSEIKYSEKQDSIIIRKLKPKSWLWIIPIIIATYIACFFGLKAIGTNALFFSAGALVCTIFNKIFNSFRYKESWIFSIAANIIGLGMWGQVLIMSSQSGIDLMNMPQILASLASLTNAFYGYSLWKSMYRKVAVNGGEVLAIRRVNIRKIIKLRHVFKELHWNKNVDINKIS